MSEQEGFAVKTGTNQAVPIAYYSQYSSGAAVVAFSIQALTSDDYLAQAKYLLGKKGSEQEVISLATQALVIKQSADAYFYRAFAKDDLGDYESSILDSSNGLLIARPAPYITSYALTAGCALAIPKGLSLIIVKLLPCPPLRPMLSLDAETRGFVSAIQKQQGMTWQNQ